LSRSPTSPSLTATPSNPLPLALTRASALRHLTIDTIKADVSLQALSGLVALRRLEVAGMGSTEPFPEGLFALPCLTHVSVGRVKWVDLESEHVPGHELVGSKGHLAQPHPSEAAAVTAAAAAAGAGGVAHRWSALGSSLRHLDLTMIHLPHASPGGRLSPLLSSLLLLTHLHPSTVLPTGFGRLPNLCSLSLSGWFCLSLLPDSLSLLAPSLLSLSLCHTDRSPCPEPPTGTGDASRARLHASTFITHLTTLTDLAPCALTPPRSPRSLTTWASWQLEWLELKNCLRLGRLPPSLSELGCLRKLHLHGYGLQQLPVGIFKLSRLEGLTLRCPNIGRLPYGLGYLGALKKLTVWAVRGAFLPGTLDGLISLEEACLSENYDLHHLPPSFCHLPRLHTLTITKYHELATLPPAFGSLPCLKRLSIDSCRYFHRLPDSFTSLSSLVPLTIAYCPRFSTLPETFGSLPRLARIRITNCNSVTDLPTSFPSLPSLRVACFTHCKHLSWLPTDLGLLPRLEVLQLRECPKVRWLPESLGQAKALRHVDVYGSGVEEEGEEVGVCGKKMHVVKGRSGRADYVGTMERGMRERLRR
ncbi:hypothetical protein CLOM_g9780, partial [Closterium sp. NIES-68]